MTSKNSWIIAGAILIVASLSTSAFGGGSRLSGFKSDVATKYLSRGRVVLAPMGHAVFCSKHPGQCRSSGEEVVTVNAAKMHELQEINRRVNRQIKPVSDKGKYGWADTWSLAPEAGDCEDYALTKRAELVRRGWPSRALRIAVAKTSWGEGHAVLVVRTQNGDLVLDNRKSEIVPWNRVDLTWLKIQSSTNAYRWYSH